MSRAVSKVSINSGLIENVFIRLTLKNSQNNSDLS